MHHMTSRYPHRRRLLALLAVFFVAACCRTAVAAESLASDDPKYRTIKTVYENIARVFGDGRMPPRLIVRSKDARRGSQVASFYPGSEGSLGGEQRLEESYISIDEKVYDLLSSSLGPDLENGIAVLIAHELAHYYNRHGWVNEFGNAFAGTKMGETMVKTANYEEMIKYETEADYFGGFYGYVAGYDTLGLASKVLDLIYTTYRLPDKLLNYPSRNERKAIAAKSEERLRKMVPLFEAANRLMLMKQYDEAARLFDFIARSFPSREMYNNAGVARALEALGLFKAGEVRFVYPFEFDAKSRLQGVSIRSRGFGEDRSERRQALLQKAAENFEGAIKRDKNYATAYVNRASVHDLTGEHEMAALIAGKALDVARKQDETMTIANALAVRGIAFANSKQKEKALADFEDARKGTPVLASLNREALEGGGTGLGYAGRPNKPGEIVSLKKENIGTITVDNREAMNAPDVLGFTLPGAGREQPELKIFARQTETWYGLLIDMAGQTLFVLSTPPGYKGQSARGIKLGSRLAEVREKYGEPARTIAARQGNYYVYEKAEMIFVVKPDDTVGGWMLYSSEEAENTPAQRR